MTHTPEPWTYEPLEWDNAWGRVGCIVAVTFPGYSGRRKSFRIGRALDDQIQVDEHANAARIVACVNACAGMTDPAAELASLRAEVERLRKENQTLSDMSQGKDDAIAELRHDLETLRADLDSQTFREELDTPKEPPDAQVRPR